MSDIAGEYEVRFKQTGVDGAVRVVRHVSVEDCHHVYELAMINSGGKPLITLAGAKKRVAANTCWGWASADDDVCDEYDTPDGVAVHIYVEEQPNVQRLLALIAHELDHMARHRKYMTDLEAEMSAQVTEGCCFYAATIVGELLKKNAE